MNKGLRMMLKMVLVLILLAAVWFANAFLGNPLSWILARTGVDRYVEQTYAQLDLQTERFGYDFKTGGYFAYLCSENSGDTAFYIRTDMLGRIRQDSFDTWVTHKYNTELRIREEYRTMADAVFQSADFPYELDIAYGDIVFSGDGEWGESEYEFALSREILELDKIYDVRELGRQAGVLCIYVMDEQVSPQRAAQIMLHIRRIFDEAEVPFRMLDFVLRLPMPEDGTAWPDTAVYAQILYEDLMQEGMTERVAESHGAILDRFARMDEEKMAESATED